MSEQPAGAPDEPIRVLTAKVGLDGHDRGVKIISRALRDAGMEVIYSGLHRTPEEIVATAIQEDVDVIGLSILSGAHMTLLPRILHLLGERAVLDRFIVVAGGVIPDDDVEVLKKMGVSDILGQDTAPDQVAVRVRELVSDRGPRA
ncbi:MAG: cobalamin B12-binding domain-containing protein [Trebonia sp.]